MMDDDAGDYCGQGPETVPLFMDECTQIESLDPDAAASGAVDEAEHINAAGVPAWGKLIPVDDGGGSAQVIPLWPCDEDDERKLNQVLLGRSVLTCDVVVSDKRVSSKHCRLFCARRPGGGINPLSSSLGSTGGSSVVGGAFRGALEVYIEDLSSNGTWINGLAGVHLSGRPGKTRIRQLHSGDEICLLNPRKSPGSNPPPAPPDIKADDPQPSETKHYSNCNRFTFVPSLRHNRGDTLNSSFGSATSAAMEGVALAGDSGSVMNGGSSGTAAGAGVGPNGEPHRDVHDFYNVMNVIGHGTSGEVRLAHEIKSGREVAIKVVETRKFALTGGLTPEVCVT
jgi:FHA domain